MTYPHSDTMTPGRVALRISVYYLILFAVVISVLVSWPDVTQYLPIGGRDALHGAAIESISDLKETGSGGSSLVDTVGGGDPVVAVQVVLLFVVGHLTGTILAMLPVAWTYKAINYESGFRKTFVRSLLVLPLCATTIMNDGISLPHRSTREASETAAADSNSAAFFSTQTDAVRQLAAEV